MHNRITTILLLIVSLSFSCKKEKNNQGTIEFDMDGVHHSFIPAKASIDNAGLPWGKQFFLESPLRGSFAMQMYIYDDSALNSSLLRPITYSWPNAVLILADTFSCQYGRQYDTSNKVTVEVTSCTGYPSVLNGNFEAKYLYGEGDTSCYHEKRITNGKITNVVYEWFH